MINCEVKTHSGLVRGKYEQGMYKWFGIPYAQKPLGEKRFRKAQPVKKWKGVLKAEEFSCKAYQPPFIVVNPSIGESEDCLYLNIWSSGTKEKKPVVFFIYGSAYIVGEGSLNTYDGSQFAKEDIVFVTFNHRLGIYGGYDFSHLSEGKKEFDDNIFLSDIVLALRWVHENISAFGGDPKKITVMGESAGGTNVLNLLASPATKGMIHQVIIESAVINSTVRPEVGNLSMRALLEHLNLKEGEIGKIKEMETRVLTDATLWLFNSYSRIHPGIPLPGGMTEGEYLPELPLKRLEQGCAKGIKMLIGTNQDEASIFIHGETSNLCCTREEIEEFFEKTGTPEPVRAELREYYSDFQSVQDINEFMKDWTFVYHSSLAADIQSHFADTYMYQFVYETDTCKKTGIGSFHMLELPFVFDTLETTEVKPLFDTDDKISLQKVRDTIHPAWVNFIKYGNPNGKGKEVWPKYKTETRKIFQISTECKVLEDPYKKMKEVLNKFKGWA